MYARYQNKAQRKHWLKFLKQKVDLHKDQMTSDLSTREIQKNDERYQSTQTNSK